MCQNIHHDINIQMLAVIHLILFIIYFIFVIVT